MSSIRVFPPTLPAALVSGHGFAPLPNARPRERDQGEMRMRPRYRSTPEMCSASWIFDQDQFDVFHDWFEGVLISGSLDFDVRVQHRGTDYGTTWFTAVFPDNYTAEVFDQLLYRVTAPLLLREALGVVRLPPTIQASGGIVFGGGAAIPPGLLKASGGIVFGGGVRFDEGPLTASGGIVFGGGWEDFGPQGLLLREEDDGDDRETDEGDDRELD